MKIMIKKNNNPFFNLFDMDIEDENDEVIDKTEKNEKEEKFYSITEMDEKADDGTVAGQITLFGDEQFGNFYIAPSENNAMEEQTGKKKKLRSKKKMHTVENNDDEDSDTDIMPNFFIEPVNAKEKTDVIEDMVVDTEVDDEVIDDEVIDDEVIDDEVIDDEVIDDEVIDDEVIDDEVIDDEVIDDEVIDDEVIDDEIIDDDDEIIDTDSTNFTDTTVFDEDDGNEKKVDPVEEKLVSMLEANSLDDEFYIPEAETVTIVTEENIFDKLPDYDEIKKLTSMNGFETAYVYHGKNGDRIRYRLALPSDNNPRFNRRKKSIMSWAITVLVAIILAVLIRMFVLVVATVDGPSMQPSLTHGDRLLVTKYTYKFSEVERGDIIICKYNDPIYPDMYVKRVIGLPGEMISIIDGVVHINGEPINEPYITRSLPGIDSHHNMAPYYIPEGKYFVIGDNRNNSADSRMESNGAISKEQIVGKARFRIFPFNKMGSLEEAQ